MGHVLRGRCMHCASGRPGPGRSRALGGSAGLLQVYGGEQGFLSLTGPAYRLPMHRSRQVRHQEPTEVKRRCLHDPSAMQSEAQRKLTEPGVCNGPGHRLAHATFTAWMASQLGSRQSDCQLRACARAAGRARRSRGRCARARRRPASSSPRWSACGARATRSAPWAPACAPRSLPLCP